MRDDRNNVASCELNHYPSNCTSRHSLRFLAYGFFGKEHDKSKKCLRSALFKILILLLTITPTRHLQGGAKTPFLKQLCYNFFWVKYPYHNCFWQRLVWLILEEGCETFVKSYTRVGTLIWTHPPLIQDKNYKLKCTHQGRYMSDKIKNLFSVNNISQCFSNSFCCLIFQLQIYLLERCAFNCPEHWSYTHLQGFAEGCKKKICDILNFLGISKLFSLLFFLSELNSALPIIISC